MIRRLPPTPKHKNICTTRLWSPGLSVSPRGSGEPEKLEGKALKQPIGGCIIPILTGDADSVHDNEGVGYELFEMKAYIRDHWKLLRLPAWQLFDNQRDPGKIRDLSNKHSEVKAAMIEGWQQYANKNQVYDHEGYFDALYRRAYGAR